MEKRPEKSSGISMSHQRATRAERHKGKAVNHKDFFTPEVYNRLLKGPIYRRRLGGARLGRRALLL